MPLTSAEELELIQLLEQEEREKVSPKLEIFRQPMRIKGCRGGRGAGAKSWSTTSLIVQRAQYETIRIACLREIQRSLEESAYHLFCSTIERLEYPGWKITNEYIDSPRGSHIIFRGLKDYRSSRQAKGLEDFDIFFVEEASSISRESWDILLPTLFRKDGSELWFCYNPEEDPDPVTEKIWNRNRDDALLIELDPGSKDNPWWNEGLQHEMDLDFQYDPDLAEHVWLGQPRKQGQYSVMSRVAIKAAMERNIKAEGNIEIGIDVARFGDDKTTLYKRQGMKVIAFKEFTGQDTQRTAREAWDMADRKPFIKIKIDDTGVGGGVTDKLKDMGAKVVPINFGGSPYDKIRYTTIADEMWFEFPTDEADIPNDNNLRQELAGRRYAYTNKDQRKIETKAEYKKRLGRSPDRADGLLLCFYTGQNMHISEESRKELAERRRKR
jgi:phage terminase large subunit